MQGRRSESPAEVAAAVLRGLGRGRRIPSAPSWRPPTGRTGQLVGRLIYTKLNEWVRRQEEAKSKGEAGADDRWLKAVQLQENPKKILAGEAPYDVLVRLKPIEQQPIGWDPDLDDGVRMNIRPVVTAGVLRKNPNIKWEKDRGKKPPGTRWYELFKGDRVNDHHLTLEEKHAARRRKGA